MSISKLDALFLVKYIFAFSILLFLFYIIPSGWAEALTAQTATIALNVFGHKTNWFVIEDVTYLTLLGERTITVSIIRECTALNVLGVMAGLILPLQTNLSKRLTGVLVSGLFLFSLNIPRIALTVYLTAFDTWPFVLLSERGLETYHYPISFIFGVLGVAATVLALNAWIIPELGNTLLWVFEKFIGIIWKNKNHKPMIQ